MTNARPETLAIVKDLEALREHLPFDPVEFLDWEASSDNHRIDTVD